MTILEKFRAARAWIEKSPSFADDSKIVPCIHSVTCSLVGFAGMAAVLHWAAVDSPVKMSDASVAGNAKALAQVASFFAAAYVGCAGANLVWRGAVNYLHNRMAPVRNAL